jgi:hypothetical protein
MLLSLKATVNLQYRGLEKVRKRKELRKIFG